MVKLLGRGPDGKPVEMDAVGASAAADVLRELSQPGFPDIPYEPDERGFGALMHEVCVVWGFCGCTKNGRPLHVGDFLPADGPVTADQFVEWVFLADNLNPNLDRERWQPHKTAIRDAFVRHLGGETVDAARLRWSEGDSDPEVKWRGPLPGAR